MYTLALPYCFVAFEGLRRVAVPLIGVAELLTGGQSAVCG